MLRKAFHDKVQNLVAPLIQILHKKGITPNQLTLAGLAINFIAAWLYSSGWFFVGGIVMLIAGLGDMLDGPLARTTNQVTKFGAFLDSCIDRYSDVLLFGGVAFYYAAESEGTLFLLALGTIAGAFVTSYSKARAENFIENCEVGYVERSERILVLTIGSVLPFLMPLALWVLCIGTNFTAIQRILYTQKSLENQTPQS